VGGGGQSLGAGAAGKITIRTLANKLRELKWRRIAVNVALMVLVVLGVRLWQQRDIPTVASALHGVTLQGQQYSRPARPLLVHFWASWCPVCRAEQSSIDALANDHLNIITVAMQSGNAATVSRFISDQSLSFPVINDPDGSLARAWGVHAVPASFIVDADGKIRFVEVGYTTNLGLRLRLWLAQF
jgi:peroxiredoxin